MQADHGESLDAPLCTLYSSALTATLRHRALSTWNDDMAVLKLAHATLHVRRFVEGNPDLTLGPGFQRFAEAAHQDLAAAMGALDTNLRSISA